MIYKLIKQKQMKKILLLFSALLIFAAVEAQGVKNFVNPNGLTIDTATNTTAESCTLSIPGSQFPVNIVLEITKISGTVGGTAALQVSNRNAVGSWVTLGTPTTLTDATNSYSLNGDLAAIRAKAGPFYRILITGTGTMSASYRATAYTVRQ